MMMTTCMRKAAALILVATFTCSQVVYALPLRYSTLRSRSTRTTDDLTKQLETALISSLRTDEADSRQPAAKAASAGRNLKPDEGILGPAYAAGELKQTKITEQIAGGLSHVGEGGIAALPTFGEAERVEYLRLGIEDARAGNVAAGILTGGIGSRMPMDQLPEELRVALENSELALEIDIDAVRHVLAVSESSRAVATISVPLKHTMYLRGLPDDVQSALRAGRIELHGSTKGLIPVAKVDDEWHTFLGLHLTNVDRLNHQLGSNIPAVVVMGTSNAQAQSAYIDETGFSDRMDIFSYFGAAPYMTGAEHPDSDLLARVRAKGGKRVYPTVEDVEAFKASGSSEKNPYGRFGLHFKDDAGEIDHDAAQACYSYSLSRAKRLAGKIIREDGNYVSSPRGHAGAFHNMFASGLILELVRRNIKYVSLRNIDNTSASCDENWLTLLGYMRKNGLDALIEVAKRPPGQVGGTPIEVRNASGDLVKIIMAEDPSLQGTDLASEEGHYINNAVGIFSIDYLLRIYGTDRDTLNRIAHLPKDRRTEALTAIADTGFAKYYINPATKIVRMPQSGIPVLGVGFETKLWESTMIDEPDNKIGVVAVNSRANVAELFTEARDRLQKAHMSASEFLRWLRHIEGGSWTKLLASIEQVIRFCRFAPTKDWPDYRGLNRLIVSEQAPILIKGVLVQSATLQDMRDKGMSLKQFPDKRLVSKGNIQQRKITFILIKPEKAAIENADEIVEAVVDMGYQVLYRGLPRPIDTDIAEVFYRDHRQETWYPGLVAYITSGPVIPVILRGGENAFAGLRGEALDEIREKFGTEVVEHGGINIKQNRLHASSSFEIALEEIGLIVQADELAQALGANGARLITNASPFSKAPSAGESLDLTDIESLNAEALGQAIAASTGNLHDVLTHSQLAAQMHKVAVEGTIAINEDSLPESQKEAIVQIYDKDSPALQELERQTGVTIRLLSQLSAEDIKGGLIMISDQPVSGYEKAKRIGIKEGGLKTTDDYMPLIPMIFMAKLFLVETDAEAIRNALNADGFYRSMFGHPVTVETIQQFLDTGFFKLPLPRFDYEAVEMLQRQALAAAIAA